VSIASDLKLVIDFLTGQLNFLNVKGCFFMMKRIMVVVAGSVMALSASLAWAGAASNVEVTNATAVQSGSNQATATGIGGKNNEVEANAGALSISSEAKGNATSTMKATNVTAVQSGSNQATATAIGGSNNEVEANANAVDIESKAEK
jgi:3D (Asp-Asp-Asp) domain-containing protein